MKKIFAFTSALILTLFFMISFFSETAYAEYHPHSDYLFSVWGNDFRYDLYKDGTCSVEDYTGSSTTITIPAPVFNGVEYTVTEIGYRCFIDHDEIFFVTIPNTVVSIRGYAFCGCNLAVVNIPDGVFYIGDFAFKNNNLPSISLPDNLEYIGNGAFEGNNLPVVVLPQWVTYIGSGAFKANILSSFTLPYHPGYFANDLWLDYYGHTHDALSDATDLKLSYKINPDATSMSYPITFDNQGGSGSSGVTAQYAQPLPQVTVPTKPNYKFGGYFTSPDGEGTKYYYSDGESARDWDIPAPAFLYAYWCTFSTVTFDKQGGTGGTDSIVATYDFEMPYASSPYMTGYHFDGYFSLPNGTGTRYYTYNMISYRLWDQHTDATLYASWKSRDYFVALRDEFPQGVGTDGPLFVEPYYEQPMPEIAPPSAPGYTLLGYYDEKGGVGTKYYNADGTSAKDWDNDSSSILYAGWNAHPNRIAEVPAAQNASVQAGSEFTLDMNAVFEDAESDPLSYLEASGKGTFTGADYSFTPSSTGGTTLVFTANDGLADSDDTFTVTLNATEPNIPPNRRSGVPETESVSFHVGASYSLTLPSIFEDSDGDVLNYMVQIDGGPYISAQESFSYTPSAVGTTTLIFKANDGLDDSTDIYIATLTATNALPKLRNGVSATKTVNLFLGAAYSVDLSLIFEDTDGDSLTYEVAINSASYISADENYICSPSAAGTTTLLFVANDGAQMSADTYAVTINAEDNTVPNRRAGVPATDTAYVYVGAPYKLDLSTIFEDADNDSLNYEVTINGYTYVISGKNYSYTPLYKGTTKLEFAVNDGKVYSTDTYTVALTAIPSPTPTPTATPSPTATPTPAPTPKATLAPTLIPSPAATPYITPQASVTPSATQAQTHTVTPSAILKDEETGTITITIDLSDLPEGTAAVKAPNGEVIYLPDESVGVFTIEVLEEDLNEDGGLDLILLDGEQVALGAVIVNTQSLKTSGGAVQFWKVLYWTLITLLAAIEVILIFVYLQRRKYGTM